MLAILPFLSWVFLFVGIGMRTNKIRKSFLLASVIWVTYLFLSTELLSYVRKLNLSGILFVWGFAAGVSLFFCKHSLSHKPQRMSEIVERWRNAHSTILINKRISIMLLLIVFLTALVSIIAPPNTWDSMTYHMSRIQHWIQNQSIAFYPTHITRQDYLAPLSEFIILHFQILTGSDRLANVPQFFSFIGCGLRARNWS